MDFTVEMTQVESVEAAVHQQQPVMLTWRNVSYTIDTPRSKKFWAFHTKSESSSTDTKEAPVSKVLMPKDRPILQQISGRAEPGKMIAIMGASGAGKTTLLNVLAGRIPRSGGQLTGEILVNGEPRSADTWQSLVAYVEQGTCFLSMDGWMPSCD